MNNGDRISSIEKLTYQLEESEQKLKETLSRYKALSDASFEGVFILIDNVCVDMNRAATVLFGYKREDIIGKNLLEFIHPDYKKLIEKNALSTESSPYEAIAYTKEGKQINIEIQSRNIQFFDKQVLTVVVRDITERKKSQESVLRLLELWESTFNSIGDLISLHNLNFEIIEANDAFRKAFGDKCFGKKCFDIIHSGEDKCIFQDFFNEIIKQEEHFERVTKTKEVFIDGKWFSVSCSPVLSNGKIDGIVHVMKDITKEKQYKDEIVRSNELYKNLLEASSIAILVYENDMVTDVNPAFLRLFDLKSKDEILHKPIETIGFDKDSVEILHEKLSSNERRKFQISFKNENNESKLIDVRARKFMYGDTYGIVAVTLEAIQMNARRRETDNA